MIAQPDGTFRIPRQVFRTEAGCIPLPGIMEQAERYYQALIVGNRYEIVDGRLEITDLRGVVTLVFLKTE